MAFETEYTSHLLRSFCRPRKGNKPNGSGAGQTVPEESMRYGAIRIAGDNRQKHQRYLRPVDRSSVEAGKNPVSRRNQRGRLGENHGEVKNL